MFVYIHENIATKAFFWEKMIGFKAKNSYSNINIAAFSGLPGKFTPLSVPEKTTRQ